MAQQLVFATVDAREDAIAFLTELRKLVLMGLLPDGTRITMDARERLLQKIARLLALLKHPNSSAHDIEMASSCLLLALAEIGFFGGESIF